MPAEESGERTGTDREPASPFGLAEAGLFEVLQAAVATHLAVPSDAIRASTPLSELDLLSLDLMEIFAGIEDEFGVVFDLEDVDVEDRSPLNLSSWHDVQSAYTFGDLVSQVTVHPASA